MNRLFPLIPEAEDFNPQPSPQGEFRVEMSGGAVLLGTLMGLAVEAKPTLQAFSTGDDRDDIARYGLCLVLEAAELVNSLPWKRWARHPSDLAKATEEFADMLCFLGSVVNLFNRLGVTTEQLTDAYIKKAAENRSRFADYRPDTEGT